LRALAFSIVELDRRGNALKPALTVAC
jgi:hypothetical protein